MHCFFFFQTVDLMVVDTKGQHFVNRENTDKGKFAFTTDDYDVFEVCFISRVPPNRRGQRHEVFLQVRGDGAKWNTCVANHEGGILLFRKTFFGRRFTLRS